MEEYKRLARRVITFGDPIAGRNGGTSHLTGEVITHYMSHGFPCLTLRELNYRYAITELRGFLQGQTKSQWFQDRGNYFWKKFPGEIIYGKQWTAWDWVDSSGKGTFDQIRWVLNELKLNPTSRRLLVTAWNPVQINDFNLPPCHDSFQFISDGKWLDLVWRQRSCDIAVGLPWDMMLYGFLLSVVAKDMGMTPRMLVGQFGTLHLYDLHRQQFIEMIENEPKKLPSLYIAEEMTFQSFRDDDESINLIGLVDYEAHDEDVFQVIP